MICQPLYQVLAVTVSIPWQLHIWVLLQKLKGYALQAKGISSVRMTVKKALSIHLASLIDILRCTIVTANWQSSMNNPWNKHGISAKLQISPTEANSSSLSAQNQIITSS
jgi:hypothetical protein